MTLTSPTPDLAAVVRLLGELPGRVESAAAGAPSRDRGAGRLGHAHNPDRDSLGSEDAPRMIWPPMKSLACLFCSWQCRSAVWSRKRRDDFGMIEDQLTGALTRLRAVR